MVIDCETPAFTLVDLYATLDGLSDPSGYCLDYLSCMSILHQLLDKIGWAYIPLGGECGMALFIAESSRRNIVLDLTEQLTNYQVSHAAIGSVKLTSKITIPAWGMERSQTPKESDTHRFVDG